MNTSLRLVAVICILTSTYDCAASNAGAEPTDRIVLVREGNLWTADGRGKRQTQITWSQRDWSPSWSYDGSSIVFLRSVIRNGRGRIFRCRSDGSELTPLADSGWAYLSLFASPTDDRIAAIALTPSNEMRLCVLDRYGRRLTTSYRFDWAPGIHSQQYEISDWSTVTRKIGISVVAYPSWFVIMLEERGSEWRTLHNIRGINGRPDFHFCTHALAWRPGTGELAVLTTPGLGAPQEAENLQAIWIGLSLADSMVPIVKERLWRDTLSFSADGTRLIANLEGTLTIIEVASGAQSPIGRGEQPRWTRR